MFTRILTDVERTELELFLKRNQRPKYLRQLMYRGRTYLPEIRKDLELIERALDRYNKKDGRVVERP
jgi:hypothetical protein